MFLTQSSAGFTLATHFPVKCHRDVAILNTIALVSFTFFSFCSLTKVPLKLKINHLAYRKLYAETYCTAIFLL